MKKQGNCLFASIFGRFVSMELCQMRSSLLFVFVFAREKSAKTGAKEAYAGI
jgi:hypothetical protein